MDQIKTEKYKKLYNDLVDNHFKVIISKSIHASAIYNWFKINNFDPYEDYLQVNRSTFIFKEETKAMLFKLTWS